MADAVNPCRNAGPRLPSSRLWRHEIGGCIVHGPDCRRHADQRLVGALHRTYRIDTRLAGYIAEHLLRAILAQRNGPWGIGKSRPLELTQQRMYVWTPPIGAADHSVAAA